MKKYFGLFLLVILLQFTSRYETFAQSDPCSLSAVLSSYEPAALSGDVQTWAQHYLERGCPKPIEQGIRTLVQAYEQMTQKNVVLNEPETSLVNGDIHALGQPWEQDGVSLNLVRLDIRSANGEPAAAQVWFRFFNFSGQRLLVDLDLATIYVEDSLGTRYVDWDGGGITSVWVDTGSSYDFNRYYTISPGKASRIPSQTEYVQVVVEKLSRLTNLRWKFEINPSLQSIAPPLPEEAYAMGQSWSTDETSLTLNNIDVRSTGGEPAAIRAWFSLTNRSSNRRLVEVDFAHIFILDSFGRRFIDWDGGGINSVWLDPGQSYEFDRYYSEMAGIQSRVTRESEFVLVNVQKFSGIEQAQWRFDIVR